LTVLLQQIPYFHKQRIRFSCCVIPGVDFKVPAPEPARNKENKQQKKDRDKENTDLTFHIHRISHSFIQFFCCRQMPLS